MQNTCVIFSVIKVKVKPRKEKYQIPQPTVKHQLILHFQTKLATMTIPAKKMMSTHLTKVGKHHPFLEQQMSKDKFIFSYNGK